MLEFLRGHLAWPDGDRLYLYRPTDGRDDGRRDVEYPGARKDEAYIYRDRPLRLRIEGGPGVDYESAEAILDDGWLVK